MGHRLERLGERTSQGRFQLAQRAISAASHRGREEVRGEERSGCRGAGAAQRERERQSARKRVVLVPDCPRNNAFAWKEAKGVCVRASGVKCRDRLTV